MRVRHQSTNKRLLGGPAVSASSHLIFEDNDAVTKKQLQTLNKCVMNYSHIVSIWIGSVTESVSDDSKQIRQHNTAIGRHSPKVHSPETDGHC